MEIHVRHILSKLGFRSHSQVAVWVAEQGLTQAERAAPPSITRHFTSLTSHEGLDAETPKRPGGSDPHQLQLRLLLCLYGLGTNAALKRVANGENLADIRYVLRR